MGTPFESMLQNAREELLSSDVNRLQQLSSKALQDSLEQYGADFLGAPISGLTKPMVLPLTGIAATYTMGLSAGAGFVFVAGGSADDSEFNRVEWGSQTVTIGAPSVSPRIDLVIATPASVASDAESRNILTTPSTRTVAAAVVNKTVSPLATISVIPGTPAGTPVPPALPVGTLPLFEVYVPVGAPDATTYISVPRAWRLATWPMSAMNTVVNGVRLQWPQTISPVLPFLKATGTKNRVIIEGEVIEFESSTTTPATFGDGNSTNNPFDPGNAAPANNDQPFYIYLVGGRVNPTQSGSGGTKAPVAIVCSLIPPDLTTGRASVPITGPSGVAHSTGTLYIGVGFTLAGSANSRALVIDGDMVVCSRFGSESLEDVEANNPALNNLAAGGVNGTDFTLASRPLSSSRVRLICVAVPSTLTIGSRTISISGPDTAGPTHGMAQIIFPFHVLTGPVALKGAVCGEVIFQAAPATLRAFPSDGAATDGLVARVIGYSHHAPRLDGGIGLHSI